MCGFGAFPGLGHSSFFFRPWNGQCAACGAWLEDDCRGVGSTIGAKGRFNPDMIKRGCVIFFVAVALALILPSPGEARCAEGSVQRNGRIGPLPAAFTRYAVAVSKEKERRVAIDWFGHSFFRIISPKGTRILTDPFSGALGLPIPRVQPDVITVSREHEHHNSAFIAEGNPIVLRDCRRAVPNGPRCAGQSGTF